MNVRQGLSRFWLVASALWATFAIWRFWDSCLPDETGWLWCSIAAGDWIMELRYFSFRDAARIAAWIVGPPLAVLIAGAAGFWVAAGFSSAKS